MIENPDPRTVEIMVEELRAMGYTVVEPADIPEIDDTVPFVAIGAGEEPPWADLSLNCPICGEGPLPLEDSDPPLLQFISHCGKSWMRGGFTR